MPELIFVDTPDSLSLSIAELSLSPVISLDCESNGMHAYRASLCLLQLCVATENPPEKVFIIDPIALKDLSPLAPLLGPGGPIKLLHDLGFDARLLAENNLTLSRVRDTSVCARFLGLPATGLASLLSQRHGITLDKSLQSEDWAHRPLAPEAIEYLANDVTWLGLLWASLFAEITQQDISAEVTEETTYALHRALTHADPRPPFARLRGFQDLGPRSRSVLVRLAALREVLAEERNVPSGRLVPSAVLLQVAKSLPRDRNSLNRLWRHFADLDPDAWLGAIRDGRAEQALSDTDSAWFERAPRPADSHLRRWRETTLTAWRTTEASLRHVDPQVVLPGHCLSALAQFEAISLDTLSTLEGFGAVRLDRYGSTLVSLLQAPPEFSH